MEIGGNIRIPLIHEIEHLIVPRPLRNYAQNSRNKLQ